MAHHLELLVEEPSMEAFLHVLLPRLLPEGRTFSVHAFQGKPDLLRKLESRLRGYAKWIPCGYRLVVLVDRDDEDCHALKSRLESAASSASLLTRSKAKADNWQAVNRVVVEELEAWFFGDWEAVRGAYPKVYPHIATNRRYRDPDAIRGGTWEAFERILQRSGYFKTGLRKVEAARAIAARIDTKRNRSRSFAHFYNAIAEAAS